MGVFKKKKQVAMTHNEIVDIKTKVTKTAKYAHMQYLQFIAVGFSEEQAMRLVIALFTTL